MLDLGNLVLFPFLREEPCSMSLYLVWHACFVCSFHLKNKQNNPNKTPNQTKPKPIKGGGNRRNALEITKHAAALGLWTENKEI